MTFRVRDVLAFGLAVCLAAFSIALAADERLKPAVEAIQADAILKHIQVLASDEFEGRGPGTPGEEKTVAYLIEQFKGLGLKPGNPDGTFVQNVPLVGFQATSVQGSFQTPAGPIPLEFPKNFVAAFATAGPAGQGPELGRRLRRLRRRRARVRLGRLQGHRRPRQDPDHAGQRPADPRPQNPRRSSTRPSSRDGR